VAVKLNTAIALGSGNNTVTIDGADGQGGAVTGSIFGGAFGLTTGNGSNTLNIQATTNGNVTTTFDGKVNVVFGSGNDTLNLAATNAGPTAGAVVEFFSSAVFNGGGGFNQKFLGVIGTNVIFHGPVGQFVNFI
jgi:hypothetical protein